MSELLQKMTNELHLDVEYLHKKLEECVSIAARIARYAELERHRVIKSGEGLSPKHAELFELMREYNAMMERNGGRYYYDEGYRDGLTALRMRGGSRGAEWNAEAKHLRCTDRRDYIEGFNDALDNGVA
jgi:hypothetical protein